MVRTIALLCGTLCVITTASRSAEAELPQGFDVPSTVDDYRASYSITTGLWENNHYTLAHSLGIQLPLWSAAFGAQFSFTNIFAETNDTTVGNLKLYLQWFYPFELARRANLAIGAGIDSYFPTATAFDDQDERASFVGFQRTNDSSLNAPDLDFAVRPRIHLAGEAWVFSAQLVGGAAIQFIENEVRTAFEWGINVSAHITEWIALVAEATGVSWIDSPPLWSDRRVVNLAGGLRFVLPGGWLPGIWVRLPATGNETEHGEGLFIGVELCWHHDRDWFLF